jgi:2-polyprenyl-3-methyl-5-hydroxy-6-metoxy-1,4-benzoquinol methylase
MNKSHLTAIARKAPSKPMRYLDARGMLRGRGLDFGCGRGHDADAFGLERFDPHFAPQMPVGTFDTVVCNYVLNVIPSPDERDAIITVLSRLLAPGGIAYISVRNDRKSLNGWTSRGTWQGYVELDLPVETSNSNFTMYRLEGL